MAGAHFAREGPRGTSIGSASCALCGASFDLSPHDISGELVAQMQTARDGFILNMAFRKASSSAQAF